MSPPFIPAAPGIQYRVDGKQKAEIIGWLLASPDDLRPVTLLGILRKDWPGVIIYTDLHVEDSKGGCWRNYAVFKGKEEEGTNILDL